MSDIALLTILGSGACHPTTDEAIAIDILANQAQATTGATQPLVDDSGAQIMIEGVALKRPVR